MFVTNFRPQDQGTTFSSSNSWSEINEMQLTLSEFEIFKYNILLYQWTAGKSNRIYAIAFCGSDEYN